MLLYLEGPAFGTDFFVASEISWSVTWGICPATPAISRRDRPGGVLSNPETVAEGCTGVFPSDVACVCREHDGTATTILVFLRSYVTSLLLLGSSCAAPGFPVLAFYFLPRAAPYSVLCSLC